MTSIINVLSSKAIQTHARNLAGGQPKNTGKRSHRTTSKTSNCQKPLQFLFSTSSSPNPSHAQINLISHILKCTLISQFAQPKPKNILTTKLKSKRAPVHGLRSNPFAQTINIRLNFSKLKEQRKCHVKKHPVLAYTLRASIFLAQ